MNWRIFSAVTLPIAFLCGALSDVSHRQPPMRYRGYWVLIADLHVHTFPLSASTLAPWDVAMEAQRQGLHAIAITGHNETISGKVGRWFARRFGGPIVLAGEEVHGPQFHLIAAGIQSTISWRLTARQAIDEIHRQGGVAIAAHPTDAVPFLKDGAIDLLDGAEILQPVAYAGEQYAAAIEDFYRRSHAAAIGSSDYHGLGPLGFCRTLVFAKEPTEQGLLEAIRAHRTVVFDRRRGVYGDPQFIPIVQTLAFYGPYTGPPHQGPAEIRLSFFSLADGLLGMFGIVMASRTRRPRSTMK